MQKFEIINELLDIGLYFQKLIVERQIKDGKKNKTFEEHVHRLNELILTLDNEAVDFKFMENKMGLQKESYENKINFLKTMIK